jgi:extracellular elastinolytic metalloproteinase
MRFAALLALAVLLGSPSALSQAPSFADAVSMLEERAPDIGLAAADLEDLVLLNSYRSSHNGVTHMYVQQRFEGIPIYNAIASLSFLPDGRPLATPHRFVADLAANVESSALALEAAEAALAAATSLDLVPEEAFYVIEARRDGGVDVVLNPAGIAEEQIPATLSYFLTESGALRLAWIVGIYELGGDHYWNVKVDAATGQVLDTVDLVVHDHFEVIEDDADLGSTHAPVILGEPVVDTRGLVVEAAPAGSAVTGSAAPASGLYRVYALPYESPSHAGNPLEDLRALAGAPFSPGASPLGWHNDGTTSHTVTRGNNVHAYTDTSASNSPDPGGEAEGGLGLNFDFALDLSQNPASYRDAAVTNLFYWNNVAHDLLYQYGFDEPAGNFQQNNFGNGGLGGDYVRAEAQDGSGQNNANFFTPTDGNRPRMQMFVWNARPTLVVTSPPEIAGQYVAGPAAFGPPIPASGLTGTVAQAVDNAGLTTACQPITENAAAIAGKVALIDRGVCPFVDKVNHAQSAGAIAVLMVNTGDGVITMGGTDPGITIPSLMVSLGDGNAIRARLNDGVNVSVSSAADRDSDFDNGVIVHEYVHGLTNRLTGGPAVATCLNNQEQAGEGWSDWYALMMTGANVDDRGIATYLRFEPTTGRGIRPARYSTSLALNPYTYADIPDLSVPHGVGFVFASMLWEMTQALIAEYGYDPDKYGGSGGNNLALQLVTDGLKLQPCSPGFVDSRDAILAADLALTQGANQCLIWEAFAKRGLGVSADQGLPTSVNDGTAAFDVPTACLNVSTDDGVQPDILALEAVYPNPTVASANIRFALPVSGDVALEVIDMLGRRVALLIDDLLPAGVHEATWTTSGIGSGSYIVRLRAGRDHLTQRVTVIR